ncbi:MAG: hypothetical protein JWQ71_2978 [Pedosphaera sp.]|nr:hypothetical protein [Pedosphaera sp.]
MNSRIIIFYFMLFVNCVVTIHAEDKVPTLKKIQDIVLYRDTNFHSAFPSIVKRPDGELLVAFRRAPDRRVFGESTYTHTDGSSQLVMVRSKDDGKTWSPKPELLFAHPFGGSQDPCMVQLRDHSILCASYGWSPFRPEAVQKMKGIFHQGSFVFLGGYLLRSQDGGHTWSDPIIPAPVDGEATLDIFGKPVPAFNRGAMCEGKNGKLYWVTANGKNTTPVIRGTHLMISEDKGTTWKYSCPVAHDEKIGFNETSIYETPKGDLVAFMRTGNFGDHACIARSTDGGKSFHKWEDTGFMGHPLYAMQLPDKRVFLVYGYRHAPMGARARILNPECTDFATAPETIIRDDGGSGDLGYPWATMLSKNRILTVYYFNQNDTTRYIAGTILELK